MSKNIFRIFSTAFMDGEFIPKKFTFDGENISPPLQWENPPRKTKSFALICDDPDAPRPKPWVHWLIKNIPPDVFVIPEGKKVGIEVKNDFGFLHYGGPAPPKGTHRYFFKLYALNIDGIQGDTITDFYNEVEKYKIEMAMLKGLYSREKKRNKK